MIFSTIWERSFVKECLKVFFLFLFCFYGLYVIIDYASHTSALPHHQTQIPGSELFKYYLYIFASRAEILIPFALLIAVIKTLCRLNAYQELVAFQAGGISLKRLTLPFLVLGCLGVLALFLNEQYVLPTAQKKLRHIEDKNKHQKRRRHPEMAVQSMELPDGSRLLFQSYDKTKQEFFDVYWIPSFDEIFRMRSLSPYTETPMGKWVEHFTRHSNGQLLHLASFENLSFPQIQFNSELLKNRLTDPETLSLTQLFAKLPREQGLFSEHHSTLTEKEGKILTSFWWRLLLPWLCLLVVLAPMPYCVKFSRQLPIFLIYVCSLFGLVAFYLLMDAAMVLANRQVLTPHLALGLPFGVISLAIVFRYWRMK